MGNQVINPREDEPLRHLWIAPDGRMVAVIPEGEADPHGSYTITILRLDQRPELDQDREEILTDVLRLLGIIMFPEAPEPIVAQAWSLLQDLLSAHRPYLTIIQQRFTAPSAAQRAVLARMYHVLPEATQFAHFLRPLEVADAQ